MGIKYFGGSISASLGMDYWMGKGDMGICGFFTKKIGLFVNETKVC